MDGSTALSTFGQNWLLAIPAFIFVLLIVVFFHELGHFLVARWCGVKVEIFSIGFGRQLLSRTDRHGTIWRLAAVPLGGYVKFIDDDNVASLPSPERKAELALAGEDGTFHGKPLWRRALIVVAGPVANFIVAILVFSVMYMTYGRPDLPALIESVTVGGAADRAGLRPGDLVLTVDGREIGNFGDLQAIVGFNGNSKLLFTVKRGEQTVTLEATPDRVETKDDFDNIVPVGRLGVSGTSDQSKWVTKRYGLFEAVSEATSRTWFIIEQTLRFIGRLFIGLESAKQLGGPIKIAEVSGQFASLGIIPLINLAALISISVGLMNLFPVPMLDGGHLVFFAIEAVRGKPLSDRVQQMGYKVGFGLVILLMVFTTWNDVLGQIEKVMRLAG